MAFPQTARFATQALLLIVLVATATANWLPNPDPTCKRGLRNGNVCCPRNCGVCGGPGCGERSRRINSRCCVTVINKFPRDCRFNGAPCKNVSTRKSSPPDPQCKRGIFRWNACCPKACKVCGGKGCWARGRAAGTDCCTPVIRALPSCRKQGPPCSFVGMPPPSKGPPKPMPKPMPKQNQKPMPQPTNNKNINKNANVGGGGPSSSTAGSWRTAPINSGALTRRHEACAVMVNGKVYLVGGRGKKPVSIYDPKTKTWTNKPGNGVEMNHMQCVAAGGKIWIVVSWQGKYPFETNNPNVYVYDIASGSWSTRPGLPPARNRGGAAVAVKGDLIVVGGGNRGGHGKHATSLGWMDSFNWRTGKWTNIKYPDLPVPRDHTGGAMVKGRFCVAGGRDGGVQGFFWANKKETYCFNFGSFTWQKVADLPTPRGGVNVAATCDGGMIVAGGEGNGQAYPLVHVFNGSTWKKGPNLKEARHGSGVAVSKCSCGHMFIPSGSGKQGGSPELPTTEEFIPQGKPLNCASY